MQNYQRIWAMDSYTFLFKKNNKFASSWTNHALYKAQKVQEERQPEGDTSNCDD